MGICKRKIYKCQNGHPSHSNNIFSLCTKCRDAVEITFKEKR